MRRPWLIAWRVALLLTLLVIAAGVWRLAMCVYRGDVSVSGRR